MEGAVWNEEQKLIDYGFSISVGNIIESSLSSSSSSQYSPAGSDNSNPQHVVINNVKNMNPGAFNKTSSSRRKNTRKNSETQTVKTTNLTDDGYGWRKYGQKNIQKEIHPKSYYRCTHYKEEKCEAKKWIQQESESPPVYNTTYLGHHTCKNPFKIPQIFFPHYSPLSPSSENLSMNSSTPILIRFDAPKTNDVFNINVDDENKTMKTCSYTGLYGGSSPPSIPSSWSDESMICPKVEMYPTFQSPNCSSGSYDLEMMIQELLEHDDNVDFMQDYLSYAM